MQINHEFGSTTEGWSYINNHPKEVSFPTKEALAEYLEKVKLELGQLIHKLSKQDNATVAKPKVTEKENVKA